jgi:hypothetical protein
MLLLPPPPDHLMRTLPRFDRRELCDMISRANARRLFAREHGIHAAINGVFRQQVGAANTTFKASGGSAAITLASLANSTSDSTGARQSVKADFQTFGSGSNTAAQWYIVSAIFDWLTTAPTTNTTIEAYTNDSSSATAGTDNKGGCSGTDAAYTGRTNDISVAVGGLSYIGPFIVSALAGADQVGNIGYWRPKQRYASVVVWNKSGRLLHSTEGNKVLTFTPLEPTSDAS